MTTPESDYPYEKALQDVEHCRKTVNDLFLEVHGYKTRRPQDVEHDYTIIGLEKMAEHLESVLEIGDRIHDIAAVCQKILGQAQRVQSELKDNHQNQYDKVVESLSRSYGHLSWEERASHYRLKTMDSLKPLRKVDYDVIEIDTMARALQGKLRVLQLSKDYYMTIVQIMRASQRLES
jgi:predicted secreted acid phosphatase